MENIFNKKAVKLKNVAHAKICYVLLKINIRLD